MSYIKQLIDVTKNCQKEADLLCTYRELINNMYTSFLEVVRQVIYLNQEIGNDDSKKSIGKLLGYVSSGIDEIETIQDNTSSIGSQYITFVERALIAIEQKSNKRIVFTFADYTMDTEEARNDIYRKVLTDAKVLGWPTKAIVEFDSFFIKQEKMIKEFEEDKTTPVTTMIFDPLNAVKREISKTLIHRSTTETIPETQFGLLQRAVNQHFDKRALELWEKGMS